MLDGCRSSNVALLLVPVSRCKVWRESLAETRPCYSMHPAAAGLDEAIDRRRLEEVRRIVARLEPLLRTHSRATSVAFELDGRRVGSLENGRQTPYYGSDSSKVARPSSAATRTTRSRSAG